MDDRNFEVICPECGQPTHDGGPHRTGEVATAVAAAPESNRGALMGVVALLLAAVAGLLIFVPGGDDESAADDPADATPATVPPPLASLPEPVPQPIPPDLTLSAGLRAAYPSDEGLVIVETETGTVDVASVSLTSPDVAYSDPFVLVADDRRTLAVHPAATAEPLVLASNYRLVATAEPEQYVFVPSATGIADADQVFVGQARDGSFGRPIALPPGARRLAVPGVGLLVTPPGGATYEVRFGGLELFSDASVIAAAGSHRLEIRCDDGLDCRSSVVDEVGIAMPIAADVAGRLGAPALSSDGRWVAGRSGNRVLVVEVATGAVLELEVDDAVLALSWVPDGGILTALVGPRETASIVVMTMDATQGAVDSSFETVVVDLDGLGAPAPIGGGVVAF